MSEPAMPPNDLEAEVLETLYGFLHAGAQPDVASVETTLAYFTEDFTGMGTGPDDYYPAPKAFGDVMRREKEQGPYPGAFDVLWIHVRELRPGLALAEGQIRFEINVGAETEIVEPRCSLVFEQHDGRWLIAHFHFSLIDVVQAEGDTLMDSLERRNRELERLVAKRTAELEAAHREARIEAALERVRAHAAEMLRSDELADVAVTLFQELKKLGIAPRRCGFALKQSEGMGWQFWHTTNEGQAIERIGSLTEKQIPEFGEVFAAWEEKKVPSFTSVFAGDDLSRVIHLLIEQTDVNLPDAEAEVKLGTYPEQVCFNFFFFKQGALLAHTLDPLDADQRATLERFAVVFELAYARYEDFRQLEEQVRESEVQLALERIRAQSLRMQHSSELIKTSTVFHEQLLALGVATELSYVWLPDEAAGKHQFWATWTDEEDGESIYRSHAITYDLDKSEPYTAACFAAWESDDP
ncbi:MAG: nuclear transport factor 2 family protein, partial [Rubricoccaceae bacterium]|nr:nuclear transport factor 2 family protein [Rubricoccaceae bacterium]